MSEKYKPYDITGEIPDNKSENPTTKNFLNFDSIKNTIGLDSNRLKEIKKENSKSYDPDGFNKIGLETKTQSEKSYSRDLYRPKITTPPKTDEPDFIDKYGKHLGIAGLASLAGLGVASAYTIKKRLNKNKQKRE